MNKRALLPALVVGFFVCTGSHAALATDATPVLVRIQHTDGSETSFPVASANAASGLSLSVADLGNDGADEIVVGNGLGNEPRVHVLRVDGSEIGSFLAYDVSMGVGINVAICDFGGDGTKEIVTVPQKGGAPQVRVFSNMGDALGEPFFAYAESFQGGVNLTCGDLDGDGRDELVTLPSAGGGPHVRVWDWSNNTQALQTEFFAGDGSDRRGLVGIVNDGELTVATEQGSDVTLHTYVVHGTSLLTNEQTLTVDANGVASLFVDDSLKLTTTSNAQVVDISTGMSTPAESENGSVIASSASFANDENAVVTVPTRPWFFAKTDPKYILVDLSEQRLYAYEHGVLADTFLISSGKYPYATPLGIHSVLAKLPFVYYAGTNLDGSTWDLGNVPWNLRFLPKHYIHYAYWHNNFGHPMSHGCVNVGLDNMKWIYTWADVGDPVEIIP